MAELVARRPTIPGCRCPTTTRCAPPRGRPCSRGRRCSPGLASRGARPRGVRTRARRWRTSTGSRRIRAPTAIMPGSARRSGHTLAATTRVSSSVSAGRLGRTGSQAGSGRGSGSLRTWRIAPCSSSNSAAPRPSWPGKNVGSASTSDRNTCRARAVSPSRRQASPSRTAARRRSPAGRSSPGRRRGRPPPGEASPAPDGPPGVRAGPSGSSGTPAPPAPPSPPRRGRALRGWHPPDRARSGVRRDPGALPTGRRATGRDPTPTTPRGTAGLRNSRGRSGPPVELSRGESAGP